MIAPARHYPALPPMLDGESNDDWNNRLLSRDTYDHPRNRQCSIGWHSECSQRKNGSTVGATGPCKCPHHTDPRLIAALEHIVSFAKAIQEGRLVDSIEASAVDVTIDALAAADKVADR